MPEPGMRDGIDLDIGGLGLRLRSGDAALQQKLAERYRVFAGSGAGTAVIDIRIDPHAACGFWQAQAIFEGERVCFDAPGFQGQFDAVRQQGTLLLAAHECVEGVDYFLRVVVAALAYSAGGMLFHGAGIVRAGQAFVFYGYSGAGKTTVARLSSRYAVLNDDLLLLLPVDSGWQVHGTPFWNPSQVRPGRQSAPLKAMFHLVQDRKVYLEGLHGGQALAHLLACVPVLASHPDRSAGLLARCGRLAGDVPVYDLHFLPDDSFWQVIEQSGLA